MVSGPSVSESGKEPSSSPSPSGSKTGVEFVSEAVDDDPFLSEKGI